MFYDSQSVTSGGLLLLSCICCVKLPAMDRGGMGANASSDCMGGSVVSGVLLALLGACGGGGGCIMSP